jgi:hypothetical protein
VQSKKCSGRIDSNPSASQCKAVRSIGRVIHPKTPHVSRTTFSATARTSRGGEAWGKAAMDPPARPSSRRPAAARPPPGRCRRLIPGVGYGGEASTPPDAEGLEEARRAAPPARPASPAGTRPPGRHSAGRPDRSEGSRHREAQPARPEPLRGRSRSAPRRPAGPGCGGGRGERRGGVFRRPELTEGVCNAGSL